MASVPRACMSTRSTVSPKPAASSADLVASGTSTSTSRRLVPAPARRNPPLLATITGRGAPASPWIVSVRASSKRRSSRAVGARLDRDVVVGGGFVDRRDDVAGQGLGARFPGAFRGGEARRRACGRTPSTAHGWRPLPPIPRSPARLFIAHPSRDRRRCHHTAARGGAATFPDGRSARLKERSSAARGGRSR